MQTKFNEAEATSVYILTLLEQAASLLEILIKEEKVILEKARLSEDSQFETRDIVAVVAYLKQLSALEWVHTEHIIQDI